ncbi:MAG: transposase [Lysobacterales bacterium]|nr:MAG: transposase [Xanthomonadales bacterium]
MSSTAQGPFSQRNGIYFITAVTDQRIPWFKDFTLARLMCRSLYLPGSLAEATDLCSVVMPDHIHVLLQLEDVPLHRVLNRLKSRSAITLNREIGRTGPFRAAGYYDHALRADEDRQNVARYIVANPLRAGLVKRIGDYPYWNAVWL